jgi:uncharacterized RDD family membrane protein YckC
VSDVPPQPPYDPYGSQPPPPGGGYGPPPGGPPPPGAYPPPGGYPPPGAYPPQGGYASQPLFGQPALPGNLAEWPQRALGYLIDLVPAIVLVVLAFVLPAIVGLLLYLVLLGYSIWLALQLGQSGATPGMRVVGLRAVGVATGQPIGAGMGVLRAFLHIIDGLFCGIPGFVIVPLVSQKKQTIADMIVSSVVITVPKQPFSITPTS